MTGQRTSLKCLSMLSQCLSFILAPSVFLVACSDSIRHYVGPSVRNPFTFQPFWPFVRSSITLFRSEKSFLRSLKPIFKGFSKNQEIFESSKGQKYVVLGQRTSLKCL